MSPAAPPAILSIDLGSSSAKAAVVAANGAILSTAVAAVETERPAPDAAEQDAEQVWQRILLACRQALRAADADIRAVTCSAQYFSLVPVAGDGHPVGPLLMWDDTRGGAYARAIYERQPDALALWLERSGFIPLPSGAESLSHSLYLRERQPDIYARAAYLLEPADYLTARLTGRCTSNPCSAFAFVLTDNRDLGDVRYDDDLLAAAGFENGKLAALVDVGSVVGTVRADVACDLGIDSAVPVYSGVNDTQAVAVGAATFRSGRGGFNIGTTCQVLGFLPSLRGDLENNLFAMPSPLPGRYTLMAENGLGGRLLDHFLDGLVFADDAFASAPAKRSYDKLEAALHASPAGAQGLLYLPWLGGASTPKASGSMRGGFVNMSLATTREDMARAVVEGVTTSLRWQLPAAETVCEGSFDELCFSGGAAESAQWTQTIADVTQRPVRQMAEPRYVNNRATALLAFDDLGITSIDDVDSFCPTAAIFEPRPETADLYDRHFEQLREIFDRMRPVFKALNPRPTSKGDTI